MSLLMWFILQAVACGNILKYTRQKFHDWKVPADESKPSQKTESFNLCLRAEHAGEGGEASWRCSATKKAQKAKGKFSGKSPTLLKFIACCSPSDAAPGTPTPCCVEKTMAGASNPTSALQEQLRDF